MNEIIRLDEEAKVVVDTNVFLTFDDFEKSSTHWDQVTLFGEKWQDVAGNDTFPDWTGKWYTYSDSISDVFTQDWVKILDWNESDSLKTDDNVYQLFEEIDGSRVFHAKMKLEGDNYPYVGFGAPILSWHGESRSSDFSNLTAIGFRAKGQGEIWVELSSAYIDTVYPNQKWGQFGLNMTLDSTWQNYLITIDDLMAKPYSKASRDDVLWEDVAPHIQAFEIENGQSYGKIVDDSLEVWMDDIRFYGIAQEEIGL